MTHSYWKLLSVMVTMAMLASGLASCAAPEAEIVEKVVTRIRGRGREGGHCYP
jgi:hypothetical protein